MRVSAREMGRGKVETQRYSHAALDQDFLEDMHSFYLETKGKPISPRLVDDLSRDTGEAVRVSRDRDVWTVRIGEAESSSGWATGAALSALVKWALGDGDLDGRRARVDQLKMAAGL